MTSLLSSATTDSGVCSVHKKRRSYHHLQDIPGQPGLYECSPGNECRVTVGGVSSSKDIEMVPCRKHNKRRPRAQMIEVVLPDGFKQYECMPAYPCRERVLKRAGEELAAEIGAPPAQRRGFLDSEGPGPMALTSPAPQFAPPQVPVAPPPPPKMVICARHARGRFIDECRHVDGTHFVCAEHSTCLRNGPVDDVEVLQQRGVVTEVLCSTHNRMRELQYMRKDTGTNSYICGFPHMCRVKGNTSPYNVTDPFMSNVTYAKV